MHLFSHVEFPGNIWISVIFLTGPAVELSLNDLLLNRQLSGHWKHTFTHTIFILFFNPSIYTPDLHNVPEGGARFVLAVLETLSPASSLWNVDGFFWLWDTKMLGIIWACVYACTSVYVFAMIGVCTGFGGLVIWSLRISMASSWGSGFLTNILPSPLLHRQWWNPNQTK